MIHFYAQIRKLIITEKNIALKASKYDNFAYKWGPFIEIYNFHGPDAFGFLQKIQSNEGFPKK